MSFKNSVTSRQQRDKPPAYIHTSPTIPASLVSDNFLQHADFFMKRTIITPARLGGRQLGIYTSCSFRSRIDGYSARPLSALLRFF